MIWDGTRNGTPNIEYGLYESWPHFSLKFALKMNLDFCSWKSKPAGCPLVWHLKFWPDILAVKEIKSSRPKLSTLTPSFVSHVPISRPIFSARGDILNVGKVEAICLLFRLANSPSYRFTSLEAKSPLSNPSHWLKSIRAHCLSSLAYFIL